jgi:FtsP/CotA-like multicopper oxidase with cupredoxin domain
MNRYLNRRGFLKFASAASVAVGIGATTAKATPPQPGHDAPQQGTSGDDMDAMHEQGIKYFLDNIGKDKEYWGVDMPYKMDGSTKVFDVVCTEGKWEVAPGNVVDAMMYNGRVPGPVIRVTQGENVRVNVTNKLNSQSTAVHWHGVLVPNGMDGVPFITQPPIKVGETFTYEFPARNVGTHMYHSHHNAAEQVTKGMIGAFVIEPPDKSKEPKVAGDYIMVLNDAGIGLTINGKGFPATQPILANKGDRIRVRYLNEGLQIHPMHLHGMYQTVIAKDGVNLTVPYLADTLCIAPGERYDVLIDCEFPGAWAFHCHVLSHAESAHGMFGMVTALVIK